MNADWIKPHQQQFGTRTGLDSPGPTHNSETYHHIDRIAAAAAALDRAEALQRHRAAFGSGGQEAAAVTEENPAADTKE